MSNMAVINSSHEQAKVFRLILDAMAHPGRILELETRLEVPTPLSLEAACIVLTLCDFQTPLFLAAKLRNLKTEKFIKFHTGASLSDDPGAAIFAVADAEAEMPCLTEFAQGDHLYPDRSTTLILITDSLGNSNGVELSGPGINGTTQFNASTCSRQFWQEMIDSRALFPLGVDVIFTAPGQIAAIPRSTQIKFAEQS